MAQQVNEVAVGQIWRDNDPRHTRHISIGEVTNHYVFGRSIESGRQVRILRRRLLENRTNGYTKVADSYSEFLAK